MHISKNFGRAQSVLALLGLALLAGCGGSSSEPVPTPSTAPIPAPAPGESGSDDFARSFQKSS